MVSVDDDSGAVLNFFDLRAVTAAELMDFRALAGGEFLNTPSASPVCLGSLGTWVTRKGKSV